MLEVNDISLHYGAAIALRGVSIKAELGTVTSILGRNGVGKTSLLRAITGRASGEPWRHPLGGAEHHQDAVLRAGEARHRLGAAGA